MLSDEHDLIGHWIHVHSSHAELLHIYSTLKPGTRMLSEGRLDWEFAHLLYCTFTHPYVKVLIALSLYPKVKLNCYTKIDLKFKKKWKIFGILIILFNP
jgi:hypothetical protein